MSTPGGAKAAVLAAVRAGLGDVPDTDTVDTPVSRHYRRDPQVSDPLGALRTRLEAIGASVAVCGPGDVAARVSEALGDVSGPVICPPGLPAAWRPPGLEMYDDDDRAGPAELAAYGAGLTGCALAVAEVGALVLDGGDLSGRRLLSLVPDVHVCVVRGEDVVSDVPQALAALDPTSPLTFVTGPSATVDIELVRTEGVHGPRTLRVVLVTDDTAQHTGG